MINKRGQEAPSGIGAIAGILLLLIVLVIVGYFVYTGFGKGGAAITNLETSQIATAVTACQAAGTFSAVDFCSQLKDLGSNVYATCDAKQVREKLTGAPACDESTFKDDLAASCRTKVTKFPANIFYGGKVAKVTSSQNCTDGATLMALGVAANATAA